MVAAQGEKKEVTRLWPMLTDAKNHLVKYSPILQTFRRERRRSHCSMGAPPCQF